MSIATKKPYIKEYIDALSDDERAAIITALNSSFADYAAYDLATGGPHTAISTLENGVYKTRLYVKANENICGILIKKTKVHFIAISTGAFPYTNLQVFEVVNEWLEPRDKYLTVDELRNYCVGGGQGGGALTPAALAEVLIGNDFMTVDNPEDDPDHLTVKPAGEYTPFIVEINAPSTATTGTLTQEQFDKLTYSHEAKIIFNDEYYNLQDEQDTFDVYTHVGRDAENHVYIKTLYIYTDETSALYKQWALTTLQVPTSGGTKLYKHTIVMSDQPIFKYLIINTSPEPYTDATQGSYGRGLIIYVLQFYVNYGLILTGEVEFAKNITFLKKDGTTQTIEHSSIGFTITDTVTEF